MARSREWLCLVASILITLLPWQCTRLLRKGIHPLLFCSGNVSIIAGAISTVCDYKQLYSSRQSWPENPTSHGTITASSSISNQELGIPFHNPHPTTGNLRKPNDNNYKYFGRYTGEQLSKNYNSLGSLPFATIPPKANRKPHASLLSCNDFY